MDFKVVALLLVNVSGFLDAFSFPYGIPQGSVLGLLLFSQNTTPVSMLPHHLYANDTQINLALDSRNFDSSIAELTECLPCIQKWMDDVELKLNPEKTKFTIIGDRLSLMQNFPTQFLGNSLYPANKVKNLCVFLFWKYICQSYNQGLSCLLLQSQRFQMHS